jgi:hypothetical protein
MCASYDRMLDRGSQPNVARSSHSWAGTSLAGLPHVLAAVVYQGRWLLYLAGMWSAWTTYRLSFVLQLTFAFLIALMIVVAWRRGWPRWSGSWTGYGLVILFSLFLRLQPTFTSAYPAVDDYLPLGTFLALADSLIVLAWLAISMLTIVILTRRNTMAGLLAILPIAPVMLMVVGLDEVRGAEPLAVAIALTTAAVAMLLERAWRPSVGAGLVFAANLIAALPASYYAIYRSPSMPVPPEPSMVMRTVLILLLMAAFWLIPIVVFLGWRRLRPRPSSA